MADAALRCVNGFWFCAECFISCSTKGNLKRHIKAIHKEKFYEELIDENPRKCRFIEANKTAHEDNSCHSDDGSVSKDHLSSSSRERDAHLDEITTSNEDSGELPEDLDSSIRNCNGLDAHIDVLYEKLSTQHKTKTAELSLHRASDTDDCNSDSELENSDTDSFDSVIWSSDEKVVDTDSDDNDQASPIFESSSVTYDEHLLAILSLATRHNLNQAQLSDVIELIKLHCPKDGKYVGSGKSLYREVSGEVKVRYHDVCESCFGLFPEDTSVYRCSTTGCAGLRYRGKVTDQDKKRRKSYFISVPFEEQFKDILERQHIWMSIQEQYSKRGSSSTLQDIIDGEKYLEHCRPGGILHNKNNISVLLNSDGIPIFRSSGIGVWPVQLVINEIPPKERFLKKNMILWGIWQGKGKPAMHAFHRPLVTALNALSSKGLTICPPNYEQIQTCVFPLLTTLDLQAKGFWLNMVLHNGQSGCLNCYTKGQHVKSGKGYAHAYSYSEYKASALRTSQQFKDDAIKAYQSGKTVNGIKGFSLILGLKHHDIIPDYVIDYMHGALLGVTKTMLMLWFSPSKANRGREFFIGDQLQTVDKRLQRMKPPDFIVRLPRSLQANLHHLKASELKVWLLYYSLPTLTRILPKKYLQHFSLFVEAMYILLGDSISHEDLDIAECFLDGFYKKFAELYGESKCGLNVHNVIHYVDQVRSWGPLWCYSCFPFEDLNGDYVDSVHGTRDVCHQIVRMFFAEKKLELKCSQLNYDSDVQKFIQRMLSSVRKPTHVTEVAKCKLVGKPVRFSPSEEIKKLLSTIGGDPVRLHTDRTFQKVLRVVINGKVYYSSEYKRMSKRISYAVFYQTGSEMKFGLVKYFVHDKDSGETFAVMDIPKTGDAPSALSKFAHHFIWISTKRETVEVANVDDIREKVFYLDGNKRNMCIARAPNFVERE